MGSLYKTRKLTAQQIIQSFIQNTTQSNQIKSSNVNCKIEHIGLE